MNLKRHDVILLFVALLLGLNSSISAANLLITETKWESGDSILVVKGVGPKRTQITITDENLYTIGKVKSKNSGEWAFKKELPKSPCKVTALTNNAQLDTASVENAGCDGNDNGSSGSNDSGSDGGTTIIEDHKNISYTGPNTCLKCHKTEAHDILGSTHYQWSGEAPYMLNQPDLIQGKAWGAVNTYCGNILGNEKACMNCHIGLGAKIEIFATNEQLSNIDCLICHQKEYKRKKVNGVMVPDEDNMTISMHEAVRTVHKPDRSTCLGCHAKAGGGDAVKRGDLALATGNTTDYHYDVHMVPI